MAVFRTQAARVFLPLLAVFIHAGTLPAGAQSVPAGNENKILPEKTPS
jgi:hypothetical protein